MKLKLLIVNIIILTLSCSSFAQNKLKIHGIVRDSKTNEPIPFADVMIKNTNIGTSTSTKGRFKLQITKNIKDTLIISFLGYYDYQIPFSKINPKRNIKVWLSPEFTELDEVVIKPGENPAHPILRNIIKNRKINNPRRSKNITYNQYNKHLIFIKDIDTSIYKSKLFKQYKKLFLKQKNKKLSIPIYFSEKNTKHIRTRKFKKDTCINQKVNNISFLDIDEIKGYKEDISQDIDIYKNQFNILSRGYISPISSMGLIHYKYYLTDSIPTKDGILYKIKFKPKNAKDPVFKGYFITSKKYWDIKEIKAELGKTANVNFLSKLKLSYKYDRTSQNTNFFKEKDIEVEFIYNKKKVGKQTSVSIRDVSIFDNLKDVTIKTDRIDVSSLDLAPIKIHKLNELELKSKSIIDSLNNSTLVKVADKAYNAFISGFIDVGKFGFGPYLEMVKKNKLEGVKINLGLRTNEKFAKNYMLFGNIGYRFKNKGITFSGSALYKFNNKKRRTLTISGKKDVIRLSENDNIFLIKENMITTAKDNIFAALFKRSSADLLYLEKKISAKYSHEWNSDFTTNINSHYRIIEPTKYGDLAKDGVNHNLQSIEIGMDNRFSHDERIMDNFVRRYYLGSSNPISHILTKAGYWKYGSKSGYYLKVGALVKQRVYMGLTKLKYVFEASHTFGNVPYPLLDINRSNQTRGYAKYSFNLMENCEYINTSYISFMPELHLNGLIFNRLPLIKHLNIREVISSKIAWGNLNKNNTTIIDLPSFSKGMNKPYCEVGFGIENIFKYGRIDAIWRLSDNKNIKTSGFGIFFSVHIML